MVSFCLFCFTISFIVLLVVSFVCVGGSLWGSICMGCGIRQGSPASGSLFVLIFNPILEKLQAELTPSLALVFGFADDTSIVFRDFWRSLVKVVDLSLLAEAAAGLALNFKKLHLVPLWSATPADMARRISSIAPRSAKMQIADNAGYLGTCVGPGALDACVAAPWRKFSQHVELVKSLGLSWKGAFAC